MYFRCFFLSFSILKTLLSGVLRFSFAWNVIMHFENLADNGKYKIIKCHCQRKPRRGHGSRSPDSFQIPTTDYLSDMILKYSLFNLIDVFSCEFDHPHLFLANLPKITGSIWGDLCKLFLLPLASFLCIFYLFRLFEIRSNCIHVMNDSGFFLRFSQACKFPSRVTLADSPILSHFQITFSQICADKISNQIGFGTVHL